MKKISAAIIFFLFIKVFASANVYTTTTVNIWHSFRENEEKSLSYLVKKFNLIHPDYNVILKRVDSDSFATIIENNYSKPDGPDIFIWAHDRLGDWAEKKIALPIGKLISFTVLSEYIKSSIKALTYKNNLYGLPFSIECVALFYNKKHLSNPPVSFEQLVNQSESFIKSGNEKYGLLYAYDDYYFHSILLHSYGGATFTPDHKYNLDSAEMKKSLELSSILFKKKIIPVVPEGKNLWDYQLSLFNNGNLLFLISGPWIIGSLKTKDWGVTVLPKFDDKHYMQPFLGVKGLFLTNKKRTDVLIKKIINVMEYLSSGESGAIMGNVGGYLPANITAYNDDVLKDNSAALVFRDQSIKSYPMPNIPEMSLIWKIMNNKSTLEFGILRLTQTGKINPENAVKKAKQQFYNLLNNNRK
ncbi:extracellular solute-binding protein [Candidatus Dependentiae bacterium]|nr:extracellular solute-binding protein [Candidatus Dependentiae bacterium]